MKKLITAQEFERAFRSQWKDDRYSREHGEKIKALISDWDKYTPWTEFMLKDNEPFFYRVLHRMLQKLERRDLDFSREKGNQFDGVYHRSESLLPQYKDYYSPPSMDVLIEHENDADMEKEMWKLLMWRSPLKVLVCYHWVDKMKLKNKLCTMADMARRVNENWQETEETEYLIVIGRRNSTSDDVIWNFKKLSKDYQWIDNS